MDIISKEQKIAVLKAEIAELEKPEPEPQPEAPAAVEDETPLEAVPVSVAELVKRIIHKLHEHGIHVEEKAAVDEPAAEAEGGDVAQE